MAPRWARALGAAATAALLTVGAAACEPEPAPAPTELTVTYRPGRAATATTYTIRCGPGTAASVTPKVAGLDARRACTTVEAQRTLLVEGPTRSGGCAYMIFGPQSARVVGHVESATVDRWFGRNDSCAERAWGQVAGLFPPA